MVPQRSSVILIMEDPFCGRRFHSLPGWSEDYENFIFRPDDDFQI